MSTLFRLLKAIWDFVLSAIAETFEWLRKPGSKLKTVCAVLAFVAATSGLNSYAKGQRISKLQNQLASTELACKDAKLALQADVDVRDERLRTVAETLRAEALALRAIQSEAALKLERLARKTEAAEQRAVEWQTRYQQRPATCRAALEVLDTECKGLEGY